MLSPACLIFCLLGSTHSEGPEDFSAWFQSVSPWWSVMSNIFPHIPIIYLWLCCYCCFLFACLLVWNRVSLCRPGCPQAQNPPASVSWALRLKICAPPELIITCIMHLCLSFETGSSVSKAGLELSILLPPLPSAGVTGYKKRGSWGWWDRLAGKDPCWPEFDSQNLHGGRRGLTPLEPSSDPNTHAAG